MESVGEAARRLLEKLDARIAEKKAAGCLEDRHEFERRDVDRLLQDDARAAPHITPDTGERRAAIDRAEAPGVSGERSRSARGDKASSSRLAAPAANDNRRDHAPSHSRALGSVRRKKSGMSGMSPVTRPANEGVALIGMWERVAGEAGLEDGASPAFSAGE